MRLGSIGSFPFYPFLLAALPVIYFVETNFRLLGAGDGIRLTIVYWIVTGLLLLLAFRVWKDMHRAALVLTPLAAVLFLAHKMGPIPVGLFLALLVGLGVFFLRRSPEMRRVSIVLNAVLLVLAGLPIVQTVIASGAKQAPSPTALFAEPLAVPPPGAGQALPDVYFLLLDGLGQPDYLEVEFGIPSQIVEGTLKQRGFKMLRRSQSNYPQTALSVAATFNVEYIPSLLDIPDIASRDRRPLAGLIRDNRVIRTFRDLGYDLVTFPSCYPLTTMGGATRNRHPLFAPNFLEYFTLEEGALPLVQKMAGRGPADLSYALRRHRLEYIFDNLGSARDGVGDGTPVFVFAHIMAPHPPFVFNRAGKGLPSKQSFTLADGHHWHDIHGPKAAPYPLMYSEQLTYVMKRLGEAVDAILASSPTPPVIIVQGDHGPGSRLHHEDPRATDHRERLGIFNAWYTPPGYDLAVPEGGSAINTFPQLFNAVYGARLPLLPDRFFYARMSAPYSFLELKPVAH